MSTERLESLAKRFGFHFLENPRQILVVLGIGLVLLWILLPVYWTLAISMRTTEEIFGSPDLLLNPASLNFENYRILWPVEDQQVANFSRFIVNSAIIATLNAVLTTVLAVPAAYAFRLGVGYSKHIFFWILTNRMAPPAAFLLPMFLLTSELNIIGTHWGLAIVYLIFNLPLAIWLVYGIIKAIPEEIDEAVYVDGGNDFTVLKEVIVPLSKPGIAVSFLLVWLFAWNHYAFTLMLSDDSTMTITQGIAQFFTTVGTSWNLMAAGTMLSMLPGLVLAAIVQKHIVTGLTFGAVKA
ncbi:sugar ABC transporter [Halobacteriales archaeon QS_1_68_17]|nr:MAG: sugar ABC transporter [Halobacteriales archaeon QS_1_68_17]